LFGFAAVIAMAYFNRACIGRNVYLKTIAPAADGFDVAGCSDAIGACGVFF
jgi:hypothetical protein